MLVVHGTKQVVDLHTAHDVELQELAAWLAQTPCGPLDKTYVSPDAALRAFVAEHMP